VGRLGGEKRVDVLIRAMAELDSSLDVVAHVYGEGPQRDELERLAAELGAGHRVRFQGAVRDVQAAYGSMDVFVMPSARESSSNALIEAQAAGVPVIVTDVGGLPELVDGGRAGVMVPAGDARGMSAAIRYLVRSPHFAGQLGQAGRGRALTKHDPQLVAEQWAALLRSVARRREVRQGASEGRLRVKGGVTESGCSNAVAGGRA